MNSSTSVIATFLIYIAVMTVIGIYSYLRTRNLSDYLLGGRKLNSFAAALSAGASDMSGWLLLGLPGLAYAEGIKAFWLVLGLSAGTYINWKFVAYRLRKFTAALGDSITLSEYFENRFDDRSRIIRTVTALFILIFFLFYTSSGLVAGGKLFESVFGLPYIWSVLIGTLAVICYTFLGGFTAVCLTDCIQGLLMFLALITVPLVSVTSQGGWEASLTAVKSADPAMLDPFKFSEGGNFGVISIISMAAWGLGYFGQPHILARFMAITSTGKVSKARKIAMSWVLISMLGALIAGLSGIGGLDVTLEGADTEKVFIKLIQLLLHPVPAGICLAAILAAIMSTADSQLLVSSSALTEDLYKPFIRKETSQKELVWIGRSMVIVIAVIAFIIAMNPESRVLDLVAYAWAGFGATFGPAVLLSLFWKRMTRKGALAGIVSGGSMVVIWKQLEGGIFDLYEIVPGFLVSVAAIVIFSLTSEPPEDIGDRVDF